MTTTATITHSHVECVAEDFTVTTHACEYVNIVTMGVRLGTGGAARERFRVVIHKDGYANQSYARVEVWRRDGWTSVYYVQGEDSRVDDLPSRHVARDDTMGAREQYGDLSSDLIDLAARVVA